MRLFVRRALIVFSLVVFALVVWAFTSTAIAVLQHLSDDVKNHYGWIP